MDESVDFIEREEFAEGTDSALKFGKKQSIFSPQSFQKILSASGQKIQPQAYKIILEALKKAGIEYTPPSSPGKAGSFNNVTEKTIELFNKETTKLKAEAGLPMSRYQTEKIKKDIKIFVKDKIKKSEYVSRPVIKDQFGIEGKSADALITRSLGINEKAGTGLLKKLGKEEAKAASIETGTKAAQAKLKDADEVLKDINNEFKLDPDISSSEDMAKKIYGSDFKKADLKGKEALVRQTDNDIVTYLKVIRGGREKPKGIKLPNQETINDIVDNIELGLADETAEGKSQFKKKGFRFSPGILRGYKFSLIDEALGLKPGTFVSERNKFLVKGKELDEIFGLSSMSRNAPGYAEAVQVLSKKVNKRKRKEIDQPMSRIVDALNNNRTTMTYKGEDNVPVLKAVKDFNKKSAAFAKKYNIRGPKINLGGNFNLNNYDNFRPESKKNIEQVFKNKNYFLSEVNNKPFETITSKSFPNQGQKKLTALQKLASGKNVGFDPILATKAGFEEFVKPAAKIGARTAAGAADLLLSAGAGPIGLGVGALIETGQAMPELTRGNIKEAGRRTIIGSLLPESLVGSMQTDLLKLAETPEEKIAMQNFIDFKKDEAKYGTSVKNLRYLENNPFEAEGIDLDILRKKVLEQRADLEERSPKVFFPEFAQEIFPTLVRRLDAQNVENLEGVLGSIVGRRGIDDRDQIIQEIGEQSISGQEPFYGQASVQMSPEELDEIYESGIMAMANGGRIGFADGPNDPSRRTFLKFMAGIASLPIVGKFFKSAKVAKVVPLKNTTTVMPEWFPQFVEKALAKGVSKKIDADLTEIEIPELPGVKVQAHDDGRILVEGKNAYNEPYEINYTPPGYEVIDETTGKAVKTPGEFQASDTRFRQTGPELDDVDVDYDTVKDIDDIVGGNSTELEGFAKGTGETKYTKGQKAVDEADARSQYSGQERADFDQGPEIDPTDYYYED
jgi:hypothetical protein